MCFNVLKFFKKENDIQISQPLKERNYGEITIKGNKQIFEFLPLLYEDANVFLDRKKEKFEEFKSHINFKEKQKEEKIVFTEELKRKMSVLKEQGKTGREIALIFNMTEISVSRLLKEWNTSKKLEDEMLVKKLFFDEKKNKSQINRQTGFSRDYIRKLLK